MKVIVIGGGPAGMMAAITSAQNGNNVILYEKMQSLGRKLLITGKGRCNITSSLANDKLIENVPGNGRFLYSCFQNYTNQDIIKFLEEEGLEVKEERGNRIFPVTDKSLDVLKCFTNKLKKYNVHIQYNSKIEKILTRKSKEGIEVEGVKVNVKTVYADKIILATGGKSYPLTGSTGDGYKIARDIGHTVTQIKPSLVPLEIYEKQLCNELQGLSIKNISIKCIDESINKVIYNEFGEMLFTHFGVSGPIILSCSSHLVRYKNIEEKMKNKDLKIIIDFKPALSIEKLNERINRDFQEFKNKEFKNSLNKLLPRKLINTVIRKSGINPSKKVNEIKKEERKKIAELLKNFELEVKKFRPIDEAIITSGGISIKEINPKTMESKLVSGLYFAGEIIDVDAYTGGFNLQIAYSTGFVAGNLN